MNQRRPYHLPSHPPEECVRRELDEFGPRILHRVSCSEYPESAIDPDGSGDGKGKKGEEGDEDEEGHRVHSVPGFLEQMDHQVDPFSKDEENQEDKGLNRQ